jgi:hypothetical protein
MLHLQGHGKAGDWSYGKVLAGTKLGDINSLESIEHFFTQLVPQWDYDYGFQRADCEARGLLRRKGEDWCPTGKDIKLQIALAKQVHRDLDSTSKQLYLVPLPPCPSWEALPAGFDNEGFQPGAWPQALNLLDYWKVSTELN